MVPNSNNRPARKGRFSCLTLNQKSQILGKEENKYLQEVTKDLLERQKEYDKLYKAYLPIDIKQKVDSSLKQTKVYKIKEAVREARMKYLTTPSLYEKIKKNEIEQVQRKHRSISFIAQIFRNQKTHLNVSSRHCSLRKNKWNLELMLAITIPILCLLVIIFDFIL